MKSNSIVLTVILCSSWLTLFSTPPIINSPDKHEACFNSKRPVIILYTDPARCAPCRAFEPVFNKISHSYTEIEFYVVNTSTPGMQNTLKDMAIQSIPVVIFGYNNKIVMRSLGRLTETDFKKKIASFKVDISKQTKHR